VSSKQHAEQLGALGHPNRLGILRRIVQGGSEGTTTTELQAELDIPWTTLNHHLDRLIGAGLVARREVRVPHGGLWRFARAH
jgi:ArsR family transcriptional regulator, arsenate/arsenite/antimonite-responsive transcriptional repressor